MLAAERLRHGWGLHKQSCCLLASGTSRPVAAEHQAACRVAPSQCITLTGALTHTLTVHLTPSQCTSHPHTHTLTVHPHSASHSHPHSAPSHSHPHSAPSQCITLTPSVMHCEGVKHSALSRRTAAAKQAMRLLVQTPAMPHPLSGKHGTLHILAMASPQSPFIVGLRMCVQQPDATVVKSAGIYGAHGTVQANGSCMTVHTAGLLKAGRCNIIPLRTAVAGAQGSASCPPKRRNCDAIDAIALPGCSAGSRSGCTASRSSRCTACAEPLLCSVPPSLLASFCRRYITRLRHVHRKLSNA